MTSLQASRTLVKSPPELWAELSELESLARHLGEFGEIRITQVDPESRVEWEADRASGTVRLEPSGWGTRVVLTVDTPEPAADPVPEAEPEPEPVAEVIEEEPEPIEPDPSPEPVAEIEDPKRGFWARLFGRKQPVPVAPEPEPVVEEPEPEPVMEEPEESEERPFGTIEWEVPEPPAAEEPESEPETPVDPEAVLHGVLDTLGAAHHRPFSRS